MWPHSLSSTSTHLVDDDDDDYDFDYAISLVDVQALLGQVVPNLLVLGCASNIQPCDLTLIQTASHLESFYLGCDP